MTFPLKGHARHTGRTSEFLSEPFLSEPSVQRRPASGDQPSAGKKPLRVLKFGGTSVGDAGAIERVIEIVRSATRESNIAVVVSAMAGVTNKLVAAARHSQAGDSTAVSAIFEELRRKHTAAAASLIDSDEEGRMLCQKLEQLLQAGERLCAGTVLLRELTPRTEDAISSLGERLSVLLVAAALTERGLPSAAIEATDLIVTDELHGGANPFMDLSRDRSQMRLRPLLQRGIVPVITGFIGATVEGVLTTLGRGGSDYSATILGAALDADEVIIWTDVDGLETADPRLVPEARTIPHISYREAAELAHFGAKVLHPKTLRAIMQCGVPLWIRNTFAPEQLGTTITPAGPPSVAGVKALTAIADVAMLGIGGPGFDGAEDILARTFKAMAAAHADVLLMAQASSQNDLRLIASSGAANAAVSALRLEFSRESVHESDKLITLHPNVALVTVVGQKMNSSPNIVGRTLRALGRQNINILAMAQSPSEFSFSFVVAQQDMQPALAGIHKEFRLGSLPMNEPLGDSETGVGHLFPPSDCPQISQLADQGD